MGDFVNDAIYNDLNTDADARQRRGHGLQQPAAACAADISLRGIPLHADLRHACSTSCRSATQTVGRRHDRRPDPGAAQPERASLIKGAIQAGRHPLQVLQLPSDADPGPQPLGLVLGRLRRLRRQQDRRSVCEPLDLNKTYRVAHQRVPGPGRAGQLLRLQVHDQHHATGATCSTASTAGSAHDATPQASPYNGGRSTGASPATATTPSGSIVPITILHHNDSHGNLAKGDATSATPSWRR